MSAGDLLRPETFHLTSAGQVSILEKQRIDRV